MPMSTIALFQLGSWFNGAWLMMWYYQTSSNHFSHSHNDGQPSSFIAAVHTKSTTLERLCLFRSRASCLIVIFVRLSSIFEEVRSTRNDNKWGPLEHKGWNNGALRNEIVIKMSSHRVDRRCEEGARGKWTKTKTVFAIGLWLSFQLVWRRK